MSGHQVETTFYAQVLPKFGRVWRNQKRVDGVEKITVVGITQFRPAKPRSGVVVVKLTLRFPEQAFMPLQPAATIEIPESLMTLPGDIEVEAEDDDERSAAVVQHLAQAVRGG